MTGAVAASAQDGPVTFKDLQTRAAAARQSNDAKGAIRLYREALNLNPGWQDGWWVVGSLQYEAELFSDGAESLARFVKLSPLAGPAWALLGLCEYETRDYGAALEHIRRGLEIGVGEQPQMVLVLKFHEAALLTKMGRFDAALQRFSRFVPPDLQDEQVLLGLGLMALRNAATPAEIPPDLKDRFAMAGRAMAAFLTHDHAKAQTAYGELIQRFPNDSNVRYAYGYFLFGTNADGAIQEWERALRLEPKNFAAHAMLSWAFSLRHENDKAIHHAQAAVAGDPSLSLGQIVLGRLMTESGKIEAGIGHLETAVRSDPASLEAHLALATAYSEAGRKQDSRRERRLCLTLQAEAGSVASP